MRFDSCSSRAMVPFGQALGRRRGDAVASAGSARSHFTLRVAIAGRFSGKDPNVISHTGNTLSRSLPMHADVQLPALDILLDQRVRMRLLVNEGDSLRQLLLVRDHRRVRDAERGILGRRLHEQGKTQVLRNARLLAAREHHELRRGHAVIGQQLLRQDLVARQQHAARIAAGVRLMHQLEKRDDMLIVGDDAVEFLQQVEYDVGLPVGDGAAQLGQAVAQSQGPDLMAFGFQMRNDVVFGAPFVDFLFGGSLQRIRGHERRMHEHQRPHLLHSETRGNWRSS